MTPSSVARREAAREQLAQAVEALAASEGWTSWVRTRAAFRRYSLSNTMLIAAQRPDATRVAGYKAWAKLGRQVQAGEKGIVILAPRTFKLRDEHDDETGEVRLYFRGVRVWDVSQTSGDPLPEPPSEPIAGESHAHLLPRLADFAATLDYTVEYTATGSAALGFCDPVGKRIVVAPDQPANARVRVLIHELAHALGVGYAEHGRAVAEVVVESAAMIACGSVGLDTSSEAVPYICGWGDGSAETLRAFAAKVDEIAGALECACGLDGDAAEAVAA